MTSMVVTAEKIVGERESEREREKREGKRDRHGGGRVETD